MRRASSKYSSARSRKYAASCMARSPILVMRDLGEPKLLKMPRRPSRTAGPVPVDRGSEGHVSQRIKLCPVPDTAQLISAREGTLGFRAIEQPARLHLDGFVAFAGGFAQALDIQDT